jgi:nitroreductase
VIATNGAGTDRFRDGLFAHAQTHPAGQATDFPFPSQYTGVYQERRRETAFQLYDSVGVARGDREASFAQTLENFRFFGAPHVLIITSERDLGPYGAVDCGIYVSSLLLLAEAAGLSAIAQAALASYPEFIRDYFGLPENRAIVCGVSIGYGDQSHPANGFRTSRAQPDDVVHWVTD